MGNPIPAAIACFLTTAAFAAETFDLAILNGRVIDPESQFDTVRMIGLRDDKIITTTEDEIEGKEIRLPVLPPVPSPTELRYLP